MASCALPREILEYLCRFLEECELLCISPTCGCACWAATRRAESELAAHFQGVRLSSSHPTDRCGSDLAYLARLRHALRPASLARGFRTSWPSHTLAVPLALDTAGPWLVEFEVVAARAANGMPTVGLVDSTLAARDVRRWPGDLSRRSGGGGGGDGGSGGKFAMSFCPSTGRVFAALEDATPQRLCGGECPDASAAASPSMPASTAAAPPPLAFAGRLPWTVLGDAEQRWNEPVRVGLYVESARLTLFRVSGGHWHSSGVLIDGLPPQVTPCMCMFSFLGYAHVRFLGVCRTPPVVCPHCDATGHGVEDGWSFWPPTQQR